MTTSGVLAPPVQLVADMLERRPMPSGRSASETRKLFEHLIRSRAQFGITRVGCVTRLDRIGIPVVQVTRPLSLSNAVSQGKGMDVIQAAVSGLMEELEVWAAEAIPEARTFRSIAAEMGREIAAIYGAWIPEPWRERWIDHPMSWMDGLDLLTERAMPVPVALVDSIYTHPSPHAALFPRTTTGMGAGRNIAEATLHAGLEVLERDAVAGAHGMPHFFDRCRIATDSVAGMEAKGILDRIQQAGLEVGIWRVPAEHGLPVYWCHLMEGHDFVEMAPFPAQGFGCDVSKDRALTKALLEACQARLSAISGAREDITRDHYPDTYDRAHLNEWRRYLASSAIGATMAVDGPPVSDPLGEVIGALRSAGARAAIVVPLYLDEIHGIAVVRLVAPPLRQSASRL